MNYLNQKIAVFLVFIIALAAAGYFIWRDANNVQNPVLTTETGPDSNSAPENSLKPADGFDAVKKQESAIKPQIPDLDRPIKISANLTEAERKQLTIDIGKMLEAIKRDSNYFDGWLQLGILRKMIGDYNGAIEAWNFAGVIRPKSTIAFTNLADLYAFYIRDNKKAEESFLNAISADPQNDYPYFQAARFYSDVLKDKEKAKNILHQGISAGADVSGNLKALLDSF
jgi:tetratricopeptide (TPR) repeat protein